MLYIYIYILSNEDHLNYKPRHTWWILHDSHCYSLFKLQVVKRVTSGFTHIAMLRRLLLIWHFLQLLNR